MLKALCEDSLLGFRRNTSTKLSSWTYSFCCIANNIIAGPNQSGQVNVLKFFFNGDDIENVVKGVYSTKDRAINEMMKQVEHENKNNISDYDRFFEKSNGNELRHEGYIQHFGEIYFEVEEVELDKASELNNLIGRRFSFPFNTLLFQPVYIFEC